jgi:exo-beta-1,3-glucanase (GH17 family)/cellulose synthase/poly-beta-1,6-N-acetylglucosamine synthase-like glycosyltransferase
MRRTALLVLLAVLGSNLAAWWWLNQPLSADNWNGIVRGVAYSPYRQGQDPRRDQPTREQIEQDIRFLQGRVAALRTYSSIDGVEAVPAIARKYGLRVTQGAWIDGRLDRNEDEIASLIHLARANRSIARVLVGNEAILRNDLPVARLIQYIEEVREAVRVPVGTAEPWHVWIDHPELARAVDFIAIHVLPYWEGIGADRAVDYVLRRYEMVQARYPDKPVVITEVGWPSDGRVRRDAAPTPENQARFMRQWLNAARARNVDFFVMEAFDQPWKRSIEGRVGAYWGVYNADRQEKFTLTGPIEPWPLWRTLALGSSLLAAVPILLFLLRFPNLKPAGQLVFAGLVQALVSALAWAAGTGAGEYQTWGTIAAWAGLTLALLLLIAIVLAEGFELVEVLWTRGWRRCFPPLGETGAARLPKVSLHLPICNEPPQMVIATLDSLARLDYPDFEVVVVDNNTADEATWRPVEAHCRALGARFRFFHLPKWPGFKAGALNFALRNTAPDAEIVGVVDSDYVVRPDWLKALVPYFARPEIGFVQSPQDHRAWRNNPFKEMINWEYAGFFRIGMVHRNERDAIIEHGTMTLIRRRAVDQVGPWAEWCICEDAEMGLRLLEAGWRSAYCPAVFGRGLVPDSFAGYKRQRHRWAFGAVQIVRRYWRWFLPFTGSRLSAGQRYHFLAGWVPWFADALNVVLLGLAVIWTVPLVFAGLVTSAKEKLVEPRGAADPGWLDALLRADWLRDAVEWLALMAKHVDFPLILFIVPTIAVFLFKLVRFVMLYSARVECNAWQRLGAGIAGLSLTYTIGHAVLQGFLKRSQPFLRTPKCENSPALVQGLAMARHETVLFVLPLIAAAAVAAVYGRDYPDAAIWALMLVVQSLPYGAALLQSMIAAAPSFAWVRRLMPAIRSQTGVVTGD